MRLKHILLPLAAIFMMGGYFAFETHQKAKFDAQAWIERVDEAGSPTRHGMLPILSAYVLKVGMSEQDVVTLLGVPDFSQTSGEYMPTRVGNWFAVKQLTYEIQPQAPLGITRHLDLTFNEHGKLVDYEVSGETNFIIY